MDYTFQKIKYGLILTLVISVIALTVVRWLGVNENNDYYVLKTINIEDFSDLNVHDWNISACFSEYLFSTVEDEEFQNTFILFKSWRDFSQWQEKTWDIHMTAPEKRDVSMAAARYREGYIALVGSVMELQDMLSPPVVKGLYTDGQGRAVIDLFGRHRNSSYSYDVDPDKYCRQIYTVIYLRPEFLRNLRSLVFAIERDNSENSTISRNGRSE